MTATMKITSVFLRRICLLAVCAAFAGPVQAAEAKSPVRDITTTLTCAEAQPGQANQWIAFRKDVTLEAVPEQAVATIAADSKYWLWINGTLAVFEGSLKRGPTPKDSYYDEVDLAPYLQKGENRIALLLWYFGKQGFSHKDSGQAQLYFDCPAAGIGSDGWLCRIHPAYGTAQCPPPNYRLPESCIGFDARKDIPGWQTAPTDGFAPARSVASSLGALHLRPIPLWKDFGIKKARFETRRGAECDTVVARLPHNMQMTPIFQVRDPEGGHRILIETDHSTAGGTENLRAEYITRAGTQAYESLGWLNGMNLILTVEHGATVTGVQYRETGYDTELEGRFSCSDPFYNRFWEKGLRTIYVNARDTFFDCPERERAQWWGDIVVILNECFYTYSTSLHALVRKGLWELCDWQKEDGSLFAPVPAGNWVKELPVQSLAAVSRYGLWSYYMNTGDRETVAHCYPAVRRYLDCYTFGSDGLTEYRTAGWNWGDWGENRDMHLLQTTWYCIALDGAIRMAELLGEKEDATRWQQRLESVRKAINDVCWTGAGYRHPAYTGETDDRVQALAVLGGVALEDKYDALFEVFQKEEHASCFMEKYVMEALFAMGHGDYALERASRRYDFMVNHPDYDTLFESWSVGIKNWTCGSVNHAWSGAALAVLPQKMFGLYPLEAGWKRWAACPDPVIFDKCELSFPTVSGDVAMSFRRKRGHIVWKLTVPEGTTAVVGIPWAYTRASVDRTPCTASQLTLGQGKHKIRLRLAE